jgi:thiamine biosynthesis lipoprotein
MIDVRSIAAVDDEYWTDRHLAAMGTQAQIIVGDAPPGVADWAVAELERLEQCWSRFRPTSELSGLNANAGAWTDVSPNMLLVLTCAADLHEVTSGRFDPTILDSLAASGYDRTFPDVPSESDDAASFAPAPGFGAVEIDVDGSRVRTPAGARVDLGGIGKGMAADLLARGLVDRGARTALVGLGGDLRARGEAPPGGAWHIPVEDPLDERATAFVWPLVDDAIVTSSVRVRAWTRAGRRHHHLIDPATGDAARTGVAAVVAAARDAWWAEGVAKSIVVAGLPEGRALARASGVRAWIYSDDGTVVDTAAAEGAP